jgi:putative hemolysin
LETQISLISEILLLDSYDLVIKILLIIFLVISSALISGSEVAFFSLSNTKIKKAANSNSRSLKLISTLRNNPRRLLAVLLVSNNFINISIVLLLSSFSNLFNFDLLPYWVNFALEVGFITLIILLFGEILPKVYASRNPISFSKKMALPIQILDKYVFFFLTIPMSTMTHFIPKKIAL